MNLVHQGVDLIHHKTKIISQTKDLVNYSQGVDYRLVDYLGFALMNKTHVHFVECCMKEIAAYLHTYSNFDECMTLLEKHVIYSILLIYNSLHVINHLFHLFYFLS